MNTSRIDGTNPRIFGAAAKYALATGVSLAAMAALASGAAHAQTVGNTLAENADVEEPQEPPLTTIEERSEFEIVVTAQGRQQSLADVPIAVSAVSGELLQRAGTSDIRELNQVAPSLLVSSTGNEANGSARIRGIGTVGDNPGLESSVAVFVDGVYRSRSGNALSELGPIDRIEILRGPQGTLGGRNASAGLISIYTAQPEFDFSGYGAFSYGNYDMYRVEGGVNVPFGTTLAGRIDGVYMKRDGFYQDLVNDVDVNDRDRYLLRGQLLFEPSTDLTARVVVDYSKKDEACCAAVFVSPEFNPLARVSPGLDPYELPLPGAPGLTSTGNPIIPVLLALGQDSRAFTDDMFERNLYLSPGRTYQGETEDYGISGEINYNLGDISLTSITGYREYSNFSGSDTDYTGVDILYRTPGPDAGAREFKTFTQEVRLQGSLFADRLDWLVGGFYANEKLQVRDNLRFGTQYGAFAPCRIVLAVNPALVSPGDTGCLSAGGRAALLGANAGAGAFGPATPLILAGLNNLAQLNDLGGTGDVYNQQSENFAFFTHNIFHITPTLDLTLGLRYTNETKDFDATLANDNVICPRNRQLLSGLLNTPLAGLAGGLISLSCQGNSTSEIDGLTLEDTRSEDEFTGTAVLSYQPNDDLLFYGSYSRGYKAGGFNLDRSALTGTAGLGVILGPLVAGDVANLQFDQEEVDAFEIGAKYSSRMFSASVAAFRQEFSNFQLNTFNGSVFLVQNVNACSTDLGGADMDASAATGACLPENVQPGVISQGLEVESTISPTRDFDVTLGFTYTDTSYTDDLIGDSEGTPLDPALRLLPGDNLSNAPELVTTGSMTWTPPIGDSGLNGLFFINARMTSDYNTGSDLLYGKEQDGYVVVNARVGITGPDRAWAVEAWAQNLFDEDYTQVAFNTPFVAPQQTYSAFLAEPRTYGVTVRGRF